ncbi:transporter substrate-binding domain-containing protein [Methylobacterium brachythecii]|uniref:ABC transporter substrate-binding protein n=1 Tax=Methylobacterium brachythecii TaxID=1176177 RepID=A0A7W6F923_9HYPH|nr:transporter substrate-binding domain-containing protein [Methylobacterium brachythecii]MBB3904701.1 urea transport system substrate-binding protein [Methylobacterium brachythecii]GLS45625.1 ABC transporter substrate-binding protein [Methylobacterium brachythecii]
MDITRRRILKGSTLAAAAVAAPHLWLPTSREAWGATLKKGEPIKVGLLFSLTGQLAVPEEDSTLVMQYAIEEINKNGGIAGHEIKPIIIDAKSDFNVYSEKAKELILREKVIALFGCYTSASRKAILPIVMQQNNLLYYPTCYEGAECTQNTICTGPLANQHSKDLIPFMVKNFGKKCFFVGSNYVWPKESNKNAKIWLQNAGGELLGEEYIPLGSSEFGPVLNKIRDAKPNFIFSTVVGASDIAFHKQFKQEGFKVDSMPIASLTTGEIETKAMGADVGAGHFLSAPYFQTLENPTNVKFVENFLKSKYGKNGSTHYNMEETYLSAYVFKYGLEKALKKTGNIEEVTSRMIRDVSGGIRVEDDISPEGLIWIDGDNFNTWLKPKIGQCQADGSFKTVYQAAEHVAPDPYSIYPNSGKCTADGLVAPDGKARKNVI